MENVSGKDIVSQWGMNELVTDESVVCALEEEYTIIVDEILNMVRKMDCTEDEKMKKFLIFMCDVKSDLLDKVGGYINTDSKEMWTAMVQGMKPMKHALCVK